MDKKKISKLKKKGWKVGSTEEFLNSTKTLVPAPAASPSAYFDKIHEQNKILLKNIKKNMKSLEELLAKANEHWRMEDHVYRYYHYSFKTYYVQGTTMEIVEALEKLAPEGTTMNSLFKKMYKEGTGHAFNTKHNRDWERYTRPMLEVFFHAKFFLEMAVKYGKELKEAPNCLPNGWAALLYFYNLR